MKLNFWPPIFQGFWVKAVIGLALSVALFSQPAAAQLDVPDMVGAIAELGWWSESDEADDAALIDLAARYGESFGFVATSTGIEVDGATLNASDLLAHAVLREQPATSKVKTVIVDADGELGAASSLFSQLEIDQAGQLSALSGNPIERLAEFASALSTGEAAEAVSQVSDVVQPVVAQTESALFSSGQWLILGVIGIAMIGIVVTQQRMRTRRRRVHTAPARAAASTSVTSSSDLILELEPRVTIANDRALKERFTDASRTYIEVQERLQTATRGHDIADLRIEMAKANWRLEVIEAELDGTTPPEEPHSRNTSGSAWDSTRGHGPHGTD